ncbi:HAMP domain-containing sensor histidine kinase [Roseateles sp. BYS87W]|uniref:histidine kinase n=1 Tax=Pelomonas baiyunensis TaxID=3299026 RepID=A0ABW7GX43_9BURK
MRRHPYDHRWRERCERKQKKRMQRMSRDWEYRWRVRHRWHQRWHHQHKRFKHSLGARLITIFVMLALASSAICWTAMGSPYGLLWAVPALLLVTGLAFGMIRHMVWPLHALAVGAEAFRRGEFSHRVPVIHGDEIGDLALRFNQMAADIQAMLDGKRALLLALSHELRSPLTRARLHAELVEEGPSRDALMQELGQMRDLISALLESERLDSGHSALQLAPCDLGALAQEQAQPGLAVCADPDLPVLQLDRLRVQLLLRNLVHNALRHNDPTLGEVQLSVRREGDAVRVTVRDFGPGVPEDALPQLGLPFYRPDAARTRHEGGVGLGLSLCRLVAEAHGSSLELRNAEPGLEAQVRFS